MVALGRVRGGGGGDARGERAAGRLLLHVAPVARVPAVPVAVGIRVGRVLGVVLVIVVQGGHARRAARRRRRARAALRAAGVL